MKYYVYLSLLAVLFLGGCASSKMQVAVDQNMGAAPEGKTQVVFLRSSFVGSAIQASVFDVTSGNPSFIGIISNGTKIAHTTTPGSKTYMVASEAADFMVADLEAGKTYYSIITPRMGVWKARFSIYPVKADPKSKFSTTSEDFKGWLKNTKFVENTPISKKWAQDSSADITRKYKEYWAQWQEKSPESKKELTLSPSDGL